MATTTPRPPVPFTIRRATFSDLPAIARTSTLAFWNDILFGKIIHPHRHAYPADNDIYWLRRIYVYYWDWSHVFLVAVTREAPPHPELAVQELSDDHADSTSETKALLSKRTLAKEEVIGTAHFSRSSPYPQSHPLSNYATNWDLHALDPRRLLKPLAELYWYLLTTLNIRRNSACNPARETVIEDSYPYLDHVWTTDNNRSPTWYLDSLAVRPEYQNCGIGRALVKWGLEQSESEGICASVISAEGKEAFYGRCGFDVGPVGWSGEGEGNPLADVPGGLAFVREAKAVREGLVTRESTKRKGFCYGGNEVEFI